MLEQSDAFVIAPTFSFVMLLIIPCSLQTREITGEK